MSKKIKISDFLKIAGAFALCAIIGTGATLAYLTDSKTEVNTFVVGNVKLELTEPQWDPDDNDNICPGKVITKDPTVTNKGTGDIFAKVTVLNPYIDDLKIVNPATQSIDTESITLFTYEVKDGWVTIPTETKIVTVEGQKYEQKSYQYNAAILTNESKTVFDEVTFRNIQEGQPLIDGKTFTIPVKAYAIQADGLSLDPLADNYAWRAFDIQNNIDNGD